jgi:hypothetical protein
MYTVVVEQFGAAWRVSVYKGGALDHRAWFQTEWAANAYARSYTE